MTGADPLDAHQSLNIESVPAFADLVAPRGTFLAVRLRPTVVASVAVHEGANAAVGLTVEAADPVDITPFRDGADASTKVVQPTAGGSFRRVRTGAGDALFDPVSDLRDIGAGELVSTDAGLLTGMFDTEDDGLTQYI